MSQKILNKMAMGDVNQAARLQERVTIERPMDVSAPLGGVVRSWSLVAEVFAEVVPLREKEFVQFQTQHSQVSHRLVVRYRDDVTSNCRVIWNGHVLEIDSAVHVHAQRTWLEILATDKGGVV